MGVIARQSIKASIVGLVGVGIGAISKLFVFTYFLTAEEIGLLDVITKLTLLLITFFILGSPQVVKKYYNYFNKKESAGGLLFTYLIFLGCSIVFSSLLYISAKPIFEEIYREKSPLLLQYIYVPLLCSITFAIFQFFNAIASIKYRIVIPNIFNQVVNRVFVLIVVGLYGFALIESVSLLVYLYALAFFVVPAIGVVFYILFFQGVKIKVISKEKILSIFKHTGKYNVFLIFSIASKYIVQAIDAQMISAQIDLANAGIYSIAFYMGAVINIPKKMLGSMSVPLISKFLENGELDKIKSLYKKSSLNQFFVGAFIFLIVWLNIDSIFAIIPNGQSFAIAKYVVLFIGIGKVYDMITGVNYQVIEASSFYKYNLYVNVLLSVLVIVLNLIFIPLNHPLFGGINGAAFASMLAMIISNTASIIIVYAKLKIHPFSIEGIIILFIATQVFILLSILSVKMDNVFLKAILTTIIISVNYVGLNLLFQTIDLNKYLKKIIKK